MKANRQWNGLKLDAEIRFNINFRRGIAFSKALKYFNVIGVHQGMTRRRYMKNAFLELFNTFFFKYIDKMYNKNPEINLVNGTLKNKTSP